MLPRALLAVTFPRGLCLRVSSRAGANRSVRLRLLVLSYTLKTLPPPAWPWTSWQKKTKFATPTPEGLLALNKDSFCSQKMSVCGSSVVFGM